MSIEIIHAITIHAKSKWFTYSSGYKGWTIIIKPIKNVNATHAIEIRFTAKTEKNHKKTKRAARKKQPTFGIRAK